MLAVAGSLNCMLLDYYNAVDEVSRAAHMVGYGMVGHGGYARHIPTIPNRAHAMVWYR